MSKPPTDLHDSDPPETAEWIESLTAVTRDAGPQRAAFLLSRLHEWAERRRISVP